MKIVFKGKNVSRTITVEGTLEQKLAFLKALTEPQPLPAPPAAEEKSR